MSWRSTAAIARKELLHIFRDGQTWALVMFTPAVLLVMFAYLFSLDVKEFDVYVLDQDHTLSSRQYVSALTADGAIRVQGALALRSQIDPLLVRSEADAVLVVPSGFERELVGRRPAPIQVVLDGSDPTTATQILGEISARTAQYSSQVLLQAVAGRDVGAGLMDIRERVWYNPTLKLAHSMVPGLLAVVMVMPAFSAAQALAKEKELGTLESLLATPIGGVELIVGKGLPYMATGVVGVVVSTAVAVFWFGVPFRGNLALFLLLGLVFLYASNFAALLLANFVESQQAAMITMFVVFFLPGFFLTGLLDPPESAGLAARVEGTLLPSTYFVTICRAVFLKGIGLRYLWKPTLALIGLGSACLALAIATFKDRLS